MKDYKAECDQLKGRIKQLEAALEYERNLREEREAKDREVKNQFKQLLINVLER